MEANEVLASQCEQAMANAVDEVEGIVDTGGYPIDYGRAD